MQLRSWTPKSRPRRKRWTAKERTTLLAGIGTYGWVWFKRRLPDRTVGAMLQRLYREVGSASVIRGAWTLERAQRETGYTDCQIRRAASALGQKWHRLSATGAYMISEEQVEDLTNWLRHDYWAPSRRRYSCVWCASGTTPHAGAGYCERCWPKARSLSRRLGIPSHLGGQLLLARWLGQMWPEDDLISRIRYRLEAGTGLNPEWVLYLAASAKEAHYYERV